MLSPDRTKTPRKLLTRTSNTEECAPKSSKSALLCLPEHVLAVAFEKLDNSELAVLRLAARDLVAPASAAVRSLKPSSLAADLRPFCQLQHLDLNGLRQEEWHEGLLASLAQASITSLTLGKVGVLSLAGTEALADLTHLRSLELVESPVLDGALRPLSRLTGLQQLSLRDCCKLSDGGLKVIAHMRRLESLDLSMVWQLTDATLAMLAASLPRLSRLDLTGCERFTAAGLRELCKASSLQTLLMPACWQLDNECLEAVAEGMPQLRCLGLFEAGENVTDDGLLELIALTNLTALDLGYSCWGHTAAGLCRLLPRLKGLQMLNLGGCEGACDEALAAVACLSQLTQLDVSESQRVTARGVQHLAKLPKLVDLSLGWNIKLPATCLEAFSVAGGPLTRLDLSFCGEMGDEALALLGTLPHLRALCLRKCTRVGDAGLQKLGRCTTLERLDLSYCSLVTPQGLRHLAAQLPRLESLRLVDCLRAATEIGMHALGDAKALRHLDASNNKRLDDDGMQALSFVSQLTSLCIRACPKVTNHGLLALGRITQLRDLDINLCMGVTPAAVARLQAKLPLLKGLRPNAAAQLLASNARLL